MIKLSELVDSSSGLVKSLFGNNNNDVQDIQEYCAKAIQALPSELLNVVPFFAYYGRAEIEGRLDTTGEYFVINNPELTWEADQVCRAICDDDHLMAESILFEYIPEYGNEIFSDIIHEEYGQYDLHKYTLGIKRVSTMMTIASLIDVSSMAASVSTFDDFKALLRNYTNGYCLESIFDEVSSISYSSAQAALNTLQKLFEKWLIGSGDVAENEEELLEITEYTDYVAVSAFSYIFYEMSQIGIIAGLKQGLVGFYEWNYNLTKSSLQFLYKKVNEVSKYLFSSKIFSVSDIHHSIALPEYPATVAKYSIAQILEYLSSDAGYINYLHKQHIIEELNRPKYIHKLIQVGNALVDVELDPSHDLLTIKTYVMLNVNTNVANDNMPSGRFAPSCWFSSDNRVFTNLYLHDGTPELTNPVDDILTINNTYLLDEFEVNTDKQILATSIANYINGLYVICARGFAFSSVAANYKILFNDDVSYAISTNSAFWAPYDQIPKSYCYSNGDISFGSGALYMSSDQENAINRILNDPQEASNADFALAVYGGSFQPTDVGNMSHYDDIFVFSCLATIFGYNDADKNFFGKNYAWVDDSWVVTVDSSYTNIRYSVYNILTAEEVQTAYRNRWLVIGAIVATVAAAFLGFKTGLFTKGFNKLFKRAKLKAKISSGISGDVENQLLESITEIKDVRKLIQ